MSTQAANQVGLEAGDSNSIQSGNNHVTNSNYYGKSYNGNTFGNKELHGKNSFKNKVSESLSLVRVLLICYLTTALQGG